MKLSFNSTILLLFALLTLIGCSTTNNRKSPSILAEEVASKNVKIKQLENKIASLENQLKTEQEKLQKEKVFRANADKAVEDAMRWLDQCSKHKDDLLRQQDDLLGKNEKCSKKLGDAQIATILECQAKLDLCEKSKKEIEYETNKRIRLNERAYRDGILSLWNELSIEAIHWSEGFNDHFKIRLKVKNYVIIEPVLNEDTESGIIPFHIPEIRRNIIDELSKYSKY